MTALLLNLTPVITCYRPFILYLWTRGSICIVLNLNLYSACHSVAPIRGTRTFGESLVHEPYVNRKCIPSGYWFQPWCNLWMPFLCWTTSDRSENVQLAISRKNFFIPSCCLMNALYDVSWLSVYIFQASVDFSSWWKEIGILRSLRRRCSVSRWWTLKGPEWTKRKTNN